MTLLRLHKECIVVYFDVNTEVEADGVQESTTGNVGRVAGQLVIVEI